MLRLLHTADVHLGARHADLGTQAAAQRERQFDAFRATVDLALAEKVDAVLIAGDLFDSNTQPKRSVERVAAELKRLVDARIRTFIVPGTHDVYDRASVYRAYDISAMAGAVGTDLVTVLTPERPDVHVAPLDAVVHGRCFEAKRAPASPLSSFDAAAGGRATWQIGLIHGALAIPEKTDGDDVVFTRDEIRASGLDYLALGHWTQQGTAGETTYAYSGAPEPVAIDQDKAGSVLLVTLDERDGKKTVTVEPKKVGRTRFEHLDVDAARAATQPALVDMINKKADKDLVLDVRLTGVRPDSLDLDVDEVTAALSPKFLKLRLRDQSTPPLTEGPIPSAETILGSFIRDTEAKIAELEATDDPAAAEWRDVLRLGRLLLSGAEMTL
jgi:DNA repair exonuclease SbcCD nuclease subunit